MDPIPDTTIHWGDLFNYDIVAYDADLATVPGCEALTYGKVSGPAALSVNPSTGKIGWLTVGADVCTHEVIVSVTDDCDSVAVDTFWICVQNDPPVADPVEMDALVWVTGDVVSGTVSGTDPDGGPTLLQYNVIGITPDPGNPVLINAATGAFTWETVPFDDAYTGHFEICFEVTDNANTCDPCSPENADTVCVEFDILKALVIIDKLHGDESTDFKGVIQGQFYKVPVFLNANVAIGGYNLLFTYDASALTFIKAYEGGMINSTGCDWEYFTYRTGPFGICGGGCPTGQVRVTAIAEYNDGPHHPNCYGTAPVELFGQFYPASDDSVLVELEFLVSSDANLGCQFVPISFYWYQCGDNTMSDAFGQYLYTSRSVWRYAGGEGGAFPSDDIPDAYAQLTGEPTFPGGLGHIEECMNPEEGKPDPVPALDFWNGGIDIICPDEIDDRGDINQNGVAYEIADAVMFTNYFIFGQAAFEVITGVDNAVAAATAASDVNADGLTLTVADLIYLIRVIVGDAAPLPNSPLPKTNPLEAKLVTMNGVLRDDAGLEISGAYVELRGQVQPELLANNMNMISHYENGVTKVLVYAPFDNASDMQYFTGDFLNVGNAQVISAELATSEGQPVHLSVLPSEYVLEQNYPNPFNPSTTIEFALPVASGYTLTIINVTGQVVAEFNGSAEAGIHSVVWEAGDNASGVYFYRLATDFKVETKKMVLLK
jgi:hypothetical protein